MLVAISFWIGVLIVALIWTISFWWLLSLAAVSLVVWRGLPDRFRYAHYPLALLFSITGAFVWSVHNAGPSGDSLQELVLASHEEEIFTLTGRVERSDILLEGDDYVQCYLRVESYSPGISHTQVPVQGGLLIRWSKPDGPLYHSELITVYGKVLPTLQRANHDVRGVENHHRLNNVHSSIRLSGLQEVRRHDNVKRTSISYWASRLRQNIAERLVEVVPDSAQGFVLTVWLGDRRRVAGDTYTTFLESGTAHILAVSGVHIGLIFITVSYFLRLFIRHPRHRIILTLLAVTLFAFVAGARISSLRAAIMIGLYLMSEWFDREPDAPTALSLAALIFGIHNPNVIFMPGFQLSFLSIASILLFHDGIAGFIGKWPRALQEGISSTLAVQILPLPAAISAFHVLPISGVLLNLIILPLLSIVLWLAFMTTLTAYLIPPAAIWFANAMLPIVQLIEFLAQWTSQFKLSHVYLSSPSGLSILAYILSVGVFWWWLNQKKRRHALLVASMALLVFCAIAWKPWTYTPNMTFLDVGHGDAAVVQTTDRKTILIDGGNANQYVDMGKQVVAPYLWAQHINKIDAIFVSHSDSDHVGGLHYILEHFPVEQVYTAPDFGSTPEGQQFLDSCARTQTPVATLSRDDVLSIGDAKIQVIHPNPEAMDTMNDNDRSLVFTLEFPGLRTLFTGDIEKAGEHRAFLTHTVHVDLIKVPHHGSSTSSTPMLFKAVYADHAVVSSGLRRNKPLARAEVIQSYRNWGMTVHRSDYGGSIRAQNINGEVVVTHARAQQGVVERE